MALFLGSVHSQLLSSFPILDCMLLMPDMMAVPDRRFVCSTSWSYHMCYLCLFHVSSSNSLGICTDRSARQHCWDRQHQPQQVVKDQRQKSEGKP